jgi:hypothetical protein
VLGFAGGLVVAVWVEDKVAEELAGGGVDDADVQVLGQQQDAGSGVGSADADVVEAAAGAQGDVAGFADLVGADPVVGVAGAVAGGGFGPGGVGGGGGGLVRQRPVRALVVVDGGARIQQGLQLAEGGRLGGLGGQPVLQGLLEPLGFALGLGLTGQSKIILWITVGVCLLLAALAVCAFEAAELFFVAADAGGEGFDAAAQLVDLHGQAGQGGGVASAGAVLVDERAQVGPPVEGGPADAGACGDLSEGDGLPGGGEFGAGGFDPGLLVVVSWHGPG